MPEVKWIHLTTDLFDDEKIKLIEAMPDADTILVIWIKLICQAGKVNASGYIFIQQNIPYTEEELATIFNRPVNTVRLALQLFKRYNMIDITSDGIKLINWEKHQFDDTLKLIREHARERQERHRLLLKSGMSRDSHKNVTDEKANVTSLRGGEGEVEEEVKDKDNTTVLPEWIKKETWDSYLEMRRKIRRPATDRAIELIIKHLEEFKAKGDDPNKILEQSIMNSWQGIFRLKEDNNGNNRPITQKNNAGQVPGNRAAGAFDGLEN